MLSDGVAVLRPLAEADVDLIAQACQDEQIVQWTTVPSPYTRDDAVAYVREHTTDWWATPTWAICGVDGAWCGSIDLRLLGDARAEVGYLVAPWSRGRGLATRSLRLVGAWGFAALGLQVIRWYAVAGNEASRAAAARVGFRIHEEPLRRWGLHRGQMVDMWVGDLLPGEAVDGATTPRPGGVQSLTRRESQVLDLMARGLGNRQIANTLSISENTVKNHVRAILDKLNATSRVDAVVRGMRAGMTRSP